MRRSMKAGVVIETIIILVALALMVEGGRSGTSTYKFLSTAEPADGTITAIGNYGLTLYIQFSVFNGPGVAFTQTGFLFNHKVDQHVAVLYDPDSPTTASMKNPGALWFKPIAMGIPGFLLLLFGLRLRSERNL